MKPPDSLSGLLLIIFLSLFTASPTDIQTSLSENTDSFITIQGTTLRASIPPYIIALSGVLGSFYSQDEINYEQAILLDKIAECESGWQEDVCSYAGCESGMGWFQIIPSTLKYCEENLGKKLDAFNGQDNTECAIWLLTETPQGEYHWLPSRNCWEDYLTN